MRALMGLGLALLVSSCGEGGRVPDPAMLLPAFKTAFGSPAPALRPITLEDEGAVYRTFRPVSFAPVGGGLIALISEGEASDCGRFCSGVISIHYLRHKGAGFEVVGAWPNIEVKGQFGSPPSWSIRRDLLDDTVLVAVDNDSGGGCGVTYLTLIDLSPSGPVERGDKILANNDSIGTHISGVLRPVRRGESFAMDYSGAKTTSVSYRLNNGRFKPEGPAVEVRCNY